MIIMTNVGAMKHFLNVRVTRTWRFIKLDRSVYAQKVLDNLLTYWGLHKRKPKKVSTA